MNDQQKQEVAFKRLAKTTPYVWIITILLWISFVSLFTFILVKNISLNTKIYQSFLQISYLIVSSSFLLHIIFDIVKILALLLTDEKFKKFYEIVQNVNIGTEKPKVLLLYCTFNDFSEKALEKSIQQNYDNFEVIILDDSNKIEYKNAIDDFAKKNKVQVVRRQERKNFKAGALNDYLLKMRKKDSYDFFVVMDSDDVLPENYIVESLKCFHINQNIGGVQASHAATSNRNFFMKVFGQAQNLISFLDLKARSRFGSVFEIGHAIMFKKEAYEFVGGFPENILSEDVAISFEMNRKNLKIFHAPYILCEEESLVNFLALKKRTSKWTRGDVGLLKRYFFKLFFSRKLKWHEKLDVIRAPFLTGIVSIFMFFLIAIVTGSVILKVKLFFDSFFLLLFLIPILFPFLIHLYLFKFDKKIFKSFFEISISLFIGMASFTTLFFSSFFGFFNKKIFFSVTPKKNQKITFWEAIKINKLEIILGFIIFIFIIFSLINFDVFFLDLTLLMILSLSMIFSPIICLISNIVYSDKIVEKNNLDLIKSFKK